MSHPKRPKRMWILIDVHQRWPCAGEIRKVYPLHPPSPPPLMPPWAKLTPQMKIAFCDKPAEHKFFFLLSLETYQLSTEKALKINPRNKIQPRRD